MVDRVMAGLDNIGHEHAGNRFAYGNVCYLRRTGRQCCGAVMQTIDPEQTLGVRCEMVVLHAD